MTNTIRRHRVLRAAPEKAWRVWRVFLDAKAKANWLPSNGLAVM